MPPSGSAFRHDPSKSVFPARTSLSYGWNEEPVVSAYRHFTVTTERIGKTIDVPISASPAVIPNVGAIIASDDGYVRFLDHSLKKVYWERRLNSSIYASLVIDASRRRVIVAATGGLIVCLDLKGTLIWHIDLGYPIFATPSIIEETGLLIVAVFHHRCFAIKLSDGEKIFEYDLPKPWHAALNFPATYRDPYASPVTLADGNAVICSGSHATCLSSSGQLVWSQNLGSAIKASPAAVSGGSNLAVCSVSGECIFLCGKTGAVLSTISLGSKITGSPAVSGNVLVTGTCADTVFGIDTDSRLVIWKAFQGTPRDYTSFSVLPDGNFISNCNRGNIICFNRKDGKFLWESSQVMGLIDHDPTMNISPIASTDGSLYCASYTGYIYRFQFRQIE